MISPHSARSVRKLHRTVAPILLLPLLVSALTGMVYRIGGRLFNIPDKVAIFIMQLHDGSILGNGRLKAVYLLLIASGLIGLVITGFVMRFRADKTRSSKAKLSFRAMHRGLTPILLLPMLITALTGLGYHFGEKLLGLTHDQAEIFMVIHEGAYLGSFGGFFYVLLIGFGLVGLALTGMTMTSIFRKRRTPVESGD